LSRLAIIADDLTGALDAAAPFAHHGPVEVGIRCLPSGSPAAVTIDTETRDVELGTALSALRHALLILDESELRLKKIDSLLRGNTFREIAACWSSGLFGSMVVAPAFPAEGRITRCGHQMVAGDVGVDMAGRLAELGIAVRARARGVEARGEGVFLCDADSDADLAAIAAFDGLAPPVLWCGSAGLAHALAGRGTAEPLHGKRRLLIVGSRHAATLGQVEHLQRARAGIVSLIADPTDAERAIDNAAANLEGGGRAALIFDIAGQEPALAADLQRRVFARLSQLRPPDLVAVTGGETLVRLCDATHARRLVVTGEWRPGIAVAVLGEGTWRGTTVVGKSGGFGTPDVLTQLMQPNEWTRPS